MIPYKAENIAGSNNVLFLCRRGYQFVFLCNGIIYPNYGDGIESRLFIKDGQYGIDDKIYRSCKFKV